MSWLLRKLGIASRKDIKLLHRRYDDNLDLHILLGSVLDNLNNKVSELEKKKKK